MCTLILLHRPAPGVRLLVAANRDEYLDRPAAGPAIARRRDGAGVLAPRDLRAGGTWLGVNEAGVFAAVTNRPIRQPDRALRSRGLLVLDALDSDLAERAAERLAALPADAYNPFNLVVADGERAFAVLYDGAPRVTELARGAHVVGNADPDDRSVAKIDRLLTSVEKVAAGPRGSWLEGLAEVCRGHEGEAPFGAACVHHGGYGTRSSTLLQLDDDPAGSALYFAEGPPCRTSYRDLTPLLHELPRTGGRAAATALGGIA
jgi:uncharacterized protein with NRDE domain